MSHFISLETAIALTSQYREQREAMLSPDYQGKDVLPLSETFDRAAIDALLAQKDCTKLRVYLGMDEQQLVRLVIVGVDADDRDLLPDQANMAARGTASEEVTAGEEEEFGLVVEVGVRCPPECPPASPLNP